MGKIVCFLHDQMADYQMTFACHLLSLFGNREIVYAVHEKRDIKGLSGAIYKPTALVSDLKVSDYDALIIPGGWQSDCPESFLGFIREMHKEGKLLCAICSGSYYLAKAGVLKGKEFTTSLTSDSLKELGEDQDPFSWELFQEKQVVRHGHVITAKPNAFIDFGIALFDGLGLFENDEDKESCKQFFKGR